MMSNTTTDQIPEMIDRTQAEQTSGLRLACGEWGFRELPMTEHFRIAAKFGFDLLEIGIGGGQTGRLPESMSDTEIAKFEDLRTRHGITTPFVCIENDFTLIDTDAHECMLAQTLTSMRLAGRLGGTHVRLFTGFTPAAAMSEQQWERLFEALMRCSELAGELNLQIALETHGRITVVDGAALHEHTVSTDPAALVRLIAGLPPHTGFNYDPGNLKAVNPDDQTFALPLLNPHINYCHLKDWARHGAGWTAMAPGDDNLDYGRLLKELAFTGPLLIEYEPTHDIEAGIARSLSYLSTLNIR